MVGCILHYVFLYQKHHKGQPHTRSMYVMLTDTDETYGYFEPLHFFLYGKGMMTWEYSPEFAIRTYAFVLPFIPMSRLLTIMGCDKITIFFSIKLVLGQGFAWAASQLLRSVRLSLCCGPRDEEDEVQGMETMLFSLALLLAAPGIFFSSTAFLPSAVCSSLVMAAIANWSDCGHPRRELYGYFAAIVFGCLAVVASGW